MRHRLKSFTHLRAQGLSKGDEHPQTLFRGYGSLYLYLLLPAFPLLFEFSLPCSFTTANGPIKSPEIGTAFSA